MHHRNIMGLTKATIKVEGSDDKVEGSDDREFTVQFNPEEYTINQDNNFANQAIPGLSAPQLQFVSGGMRTLETELFFDTYDTPESEKEDVRKITNRFIKLPWRLTRSCMRPPFCDSSGRNSIFAVFWRAPARSSLVFRERRSPGARPRHGDFQ